MVFRFKTVQLSDSDCDFDIVRGRYWIGPAAYGKVAHFSFDPSLVAALVAWGQSFFQDLTEHILMQLCVCLRGESQET